MKETQIKFCLKKRENSKLNWVLGLITQVLRLVQTMCSVATSQKLLFLFALYLLYSDNLTKRESQAWWEHNQLPVWQAVTKDSHGCSVKISIYLQNLVILSWQQICQTTIASHLTVACVSALFASQCGLMAHFGPQRSNWHHLWTILHRTSILYWQQICDKLLNSNFYKDLLCHFSVKSQKFLSSSFKKKKWYNENIFWYIINILCIDLNTVHCCQCMCDGDSV